MSNPAPRLSVYRVWVLCYEAPCGCLKCIATSTNTVYTVFLELCRYCTVKIHYSSVIFIFSAVVIASVSLQMYRIYRHTSLWELTFCCAWFVTAELLIRVGQCHALGHCVSQLYNIILKGASCHSKICFHNAQLRLKVQ